MRFLYAFFIIFSILFSSCTLQLRKNKLHQLSSHSTVPKKNISFTTDISSNIGPGDILKINVYGEKELSGLYQVNPNGEIVFPFIGVVNVNNRDNLSLAQIIVKKLKKGYIKNPQVTVFVKDVVSKSVFVLGQVKKAGKYPMKTRLNLVEAIALAGGFTKFADTTNVVVRRKINNGDKRFIINVKLIVNGSKPTFILMPGDIIFVKERFF